MCICVRVGLFANQKHLIYVYTTLLMYVYSAILVWVNFYTGTVFFVRTTYLCVSNIFEVNL